MLQEAQPQGCFGLEYLLQTSEDEALASDIRQVGTATLIKNTQCAYMVEISTLVLDGGRGLTLCQGAEE